MKARYIKQDDSGVTATLEYVLTFVFAFIIFSFMMLMFNSLFIEGPKQTVESVQYADVGNDVAAKLMDTYLVAPTSGTMTTNFDIPRTVGGDSYQLIVDNRIGSNDKEIIVRSMDSTKSSYVTLNGVSLTMDIAGNTSSSSEVHKITYT